MENNEESLALDVVSAAVRHELIAQRAYEIWEQEGRPIGDDLAHWFRAEETLARETFAVPAKETFAAP